jgi:hypothetical protein
VLRSVIASALKFQSRRSAAGAAHVRRVDGVERVVAAFGERLRLDEQRHRALRRTRRIEGAAPLEQVAHAHERGRAVEPRGHRVERRVRFGELAAQPLRPRDLGADDQRLRVSGRPPREFRPKPLLG